MSERKTQNMRKVILFIALSLLTGASMMAATTGTLFTVPAGESGYAKLEISAPRLLDTYYIEFRQVGGPNVVYLNLLRANPMYDSTWNTPNPSADPNSVIYAIASDHSEYNYWELEVFDIPPGDYYVVYNGHGVAQTTQPSFTSELHAILYLLENEDLWLWYEYGTHLLPWAPYSYTITDASPLMSISVTQFSY